MKRLQAILAVGFVFVLGLIHVVHAGVSDADALGAIEATDVIPSSSLPMGALYYSAANPSGPAMPGSMGYDAWQIDSNTFLLDDLDSSSGFSGHGMGMMDDSSPPGFDDSGDGTNYYPSCTYTFDTNSLWLQITNVSGGLAYVNLMNGTDSVYEIFSKTDLTLTNWTIEQEVWPGDTNCMPFIVPESNRTNLFLWARDWTGIDENSNGIADWWEWKYFGNFNQSAANDYDGDGVDNYNEFLNGTDPNKIVFSLQFTNKYVNTSLVNGTVTVLGGVPSYMAVLVDDTNFADATWNAYASSSVMVNLGSVGGWHDVWVGLRGLPADATQTWQWKHLNLTLPPVLVITNPVVNLVSQPMIQIYGYCQESLASISYDISNAVGVVTNQQSEITDRYYDTNVWGFTTNYFECLDVPLTNGVNTITLHATDLAGDTTTTNFNFTLDYSSKTNPPIVQITWPQNGTQISGSNFTCRGTIGDPTATVTTQLVSTNGGVVSTNVYSAEVERNGNFWLENLPIKTGTNAFTLTVMDAVGNTSVTNISVVQSALVLTVNPVTPDSQLWQPTVNLTGTISITNYAVWVNGVKGHNNGNGTWSASNVPVNSGGTASFTATAYSPSEQQPDGSYGN